METISRSVEDTHAFARTLLDRYGRGTVLALHGELGSGKTCLVQGLARAMKIEQPVTSPTFKIVNEYRGIFPLYHIDLYRIGSPQEALDFGLDEYLESDGITAIEWAERAGELLPPDTVHVSLEILPGTTDRSIRCRTGPEIED